MKKIFILMLCILFCGCNDAKQKNSINFLLDWTPNVHHIGLFVAKDLGYFKEAGINVNILSATNESTKEVISAGGADMGVSFQTSLSKILNKPTNLIAIATIMQKNFAGFIYNNKLIKSPIDLNNKIFGGYDTKIDNLIIKTLIKSDPKYSNQPINLKFLNSYDMDILSSLLRGDSNFAWGYEDIEGIEAKIKDYPLGFFRLSDYSKSLIYYDPIIIANTDFLKNNEILCKKFLQALSKGYKFAVSHPDEASEILIKNAVGINKELVKKSIRLSTSAFLDENGDWGVMRAEVFSNFTNFLYKNGVINRLIPNEEIFTNKYLK